MTKAATSDKLDALRTTVDAALSDRIGDSQNSPVERAMRYALLSEGKRLRPILALGVAEIAGRPLDDVMDTACAMESVHAASLILDDLPCMDNSDERRGRPSTHVEFGEATAILAAFGLIARAFDWVGNDAERNNAGAAPQSLLAHTIGPEGLVGGQIADLSLDHSTSVGEETLAEISGRKSASLFAASVIIPAHILGMDDTVKRELDSFAAKFGVAFQMADDLADLRSGHDDETQATFSTVMGEEAAADRFHTLIESARKTLIALDAPTNILENVCDSVQDWAE